MNEIYKPETFKQKLGYLIEECGETMAAVGKTIRWGLDSFNPELPEKDQELNRDWIKRELKDLRRAIQFVEDEIDAVLTNEV
jgi:NTP pyrophosphatase (non-canonical NTP hydrolase)